jgi:hypothetical protein
MVKFICRSKLILFVFCRTSLHICPSIFYSWYLLFNFFILGYLSFSWFCTTYWDEMGWEREISCVLRKIFSLAFVYWSYTFKKNKYEFLSKITYTNKRMIVQITQKKIKFCLRVIWCVIVRDSYLFQLIKKWILDEVFKKNVANTSHKIHTKNLIYPLNYSTTLSF